MKKQFALVLSVIFILSLCFPLSAFADENPTDNTATVQAGTLPDSFWYSFDTFMETIQRTFTISAEKKALLEQRISEERLAEADAMTQAEKDELVIMVLKAYAQSAGNTLELAAKASETGVSVDEVMSRMEKAEVAAGDILDAAKDLGLIENTTFEEIKGMLAQQLVESVSVKALVAANMEMKEANKALKDAEKNLRKAEKSGQEDAVKAAKDELARVQGEYDVAKALKENLKGMKDKIKDEIDTDTEENEEEAVKDPESIQKKIDKLQALHTRQLEKLAELTAKFENHNGKASSHVIDNFKSVVDRTGERLDALTQSIGSGEPQATDEKIEQQGENDDNDEINNDDEDKDEDQDSDEAAKPDKDSKTVKTDKIDKEKGNSEAKDKK